MLFLLSHMRFIIVFLSFIFRVTGLSSILLLCAGIGRIVSAFVGIVVYMCPVVCVVKGLSLSACVCVCELVYRSNVVLYCF